MMGSRTVSLISNGSRANLPRLGATTRGSPSGDTAQRLFPCQLRHTGEVAQLPQRHVGQSGGRAKNWMSQPPLSFQVLATLTMPS